MAFKADGCVVLAADTRGIRVQDGMNYDRGRVSKLRSLGDGCAEGITGDLCLMGQLLDDAKSRGLGFGKAKRFSDTVYEFERTLRQMYEQKFGNAGVDPKERFPSSLLFAGHGVYGGERDCFIYTMHVQQNFAAVRQNEWDAIGQWLHGGCYYACRYYRPTMTEKEAAFLAYFCIGEVGKLDGTVGLPVDIMILRDNSVQSIPGQWSEEFKSKYEAAHDKMESWFRWDK
ncbi:MAG: hypothetical protein ACE5HL_00300 [Terriglobia bacterium]